MKPKETSCRWFNNDAEVASLDARLKGFNFYVGQILGTAIEKWECNLNSSQTLQATFVINPKINQLQYTNNII